MTDHHCSSYSKLKTDGNFRTCTAANVKVGDIIKIKQNDRVPADCILLYTTEKNGTVFIRTDQLDGETDWKLRKACNSTQMVPQPTQLATIDATIVANPPNDLIYDFKGVLEHHGM